MERDSYGDSGEYGRGADSAAGEGGEKRDGMLSELARKAVASSVSKLVETEGFVREMMKAMSREFAAYIGREVAGLRQEVVGQATDKVVQWLDNINIADEVRKSLDGMTFDINVKVHVTDEGVQPGRAPKRKAAAAAKGARSVSRSAKTADPGAKPAVRSPRKTGTGKSASSGNLS